VESKDEGDIDNYFFQLEACGDNYKSVYMASLVNV
jgi:hypothetical protein